MVSAGVSTAQMRSPISRLPPFAFRDTLAQQTSLRVPAPFMANLPDTSASSWVAALFAAGAVAAAGWWPLRRSRSRTERDLDVARQKLDAGQWSEALELTKKHRPDEAAPIEPWHEIRRLLEGDCLIAGSEAALRESRFSDAMALYRNAATVLGLSPDEASRRIVEAMLGELRRLSADEPNSTALPELASLIVEQDSDSGEAAFWRGVYQLRRGDRAAAKSDLTHAYAQRHALQIDPTLYLGTMRLQDGAPREALRFLVEANKLAPQCPLVAWQLGTALIATGGDVMLAVRALQKATGPEGLVRFLSEPVRIWIDTLPRDSWIRNLVRRSGSQRTRFVCPLGLDRLKEILESARLTSAEALIDCRRPGEAATLFQELRRTRDDLAVHRGFGIALADLGRFDEALPHLEKARAAASSPDSRTIGALARCRARASGDRIGNLQQALSLIEKAPTPIDAEWARNASAVISAAQLAGMAIPSKLVLELADALIAADATDPAAVAIYDLLALRDPNSLPHEAAWLYVRAAEREEVSLANDDVLFDRAFADRDGMIRFFDSREWDFAAAERLYLQRWAERSAGTGETAKTQHSGVAQANLLAEAERHLSQNQLDAAQSSIELAHRLMPNSPRVYDLLAELSYRRGQFDRSVDWLQRWSQLEPKSPLPLTRAGLIRRRQNRLDEARPLLARALSIAHGPARAPIALLLARFAAAAGKHRDALEFVDECLTFDSNNAIALAARAALLMTLKEPTQLTGLLAPLSNLNVEDAHTHCLIGITAYLANDDQLAIERAKLCIQNKNTAADGYYLRAASTLRADQVSPAMSDLREAVERATGPIEESARVLLGQLSWRAGQYADALRAWQPISAARLKARGLETLIPDTAFLAGLAAARSGRLDEAAKWWRSAARLRCGHPLLDELLAGAVEGSDVKHIASRLEQAQDAAGPRPTIVRRLARCYRLLGRWKDAQKLLDSAQQSNAPVLVERGLLHLATHQFVAAERAFAEALGLDPGSEAAAVNLLLSRLSLGRWEEAKAALPKAAELASAPAARQLCRLLAHLIAEPPTAGLDWTSDDDEAMIRLCRSLGRLETAEALFAALVAVRGDNATIQKAHDEIRPLLAKQLLDRGNSADVLKKFGPKAAGAPRSMRNLLGVAAALRQDFESAIRHFQAALPADGADARVQQNLAIVFGWQGRAPEAIEHWRRFLGLFDKQIARPKDIREYRRRIVEMVHAKLQKLERATES